MTTTTKSIVSHLNTLIQTCKDGQKGYTDAAEHTKDLELRTLFTKYAAQRTQFATELQDLVSVYGGEPETESSVASAVHRGWIDFKSLLTGHSDHAVLAECERGEDSAKATFRDVLEDNELPAEVLRLVQEQYEQIQQAHDRIKALRDAAK